MLVHADESKRTKNVTITFMTKYVAFLRGVNVGGRIIKKDELKTCFEKLGLENVSTVIQSGNVVFESNLKEAELKKKIEEALTKTFNYPAKAQVITIPILKKIIDAFPFGTAAPKQHNYVIFVENGLEKDMMADQYELGAGEKVKAGSGVIYWRVDQGQTLRSLFGKTLSKSKYKNFNTNRNVNTLQRILKI
jgi:uncharacterized protein (DUF1697 family)